jgi:uncharacterized membrane protein
MLERSMQALAEVEGLDAAVHVLRDVADRVPEELRPVLEGEWLGHPLHPALTDLPIGFWTTSWVLDILGGRRSARTATVLVGLGIASAVPTVAAGLADWRHLSPERQRVGVVHAASNAVATACYVASFAARLRGRRARGIAWGMAGAGAATVGGYLGGHLVFGDDSAPAEPGSPGVVGEDPTRFEPGGFAPLDEAPNGQTAQDVTRSSGSSLPPR